jgi:hypothetical protein
VLAVPAHRARAVIIEDILEDGGDSGPDHGPAFTLAAVVFVTLAGSAALAAVYLLLLR